jgi:TPR repeat protein
VAKDPPRAAALYQQGCDGGYTLGCINLAELHIRGTGVPRDDGRAAALFERACKAGDVRACNRWNELKP